MERTIANAERLAIALKQISELSETKLSVAVFGLAGRNGPEEFEQPVPSRNQPFCLQPGISETQDCREALP